MKKLLVIILALVGIQCANKVASTTDETVTGTKAMLYYTNGSPVQGATIKVFETGDTTREPVSIAITDANGQYSLASITKGTYNVWAEKDTLVAYQDSVLIYSNSNTLHQDTVRPEGSITAIVGMQPNHDPRTAFVQILGSEHYANVDSAGRFTISGLTNGTYSMKIITSEPNYTPTFFSVNAHAGKNDTLKDTLWLVYTGIPVVTGLNATYDTAGGVVHLWWKKTAYRNFQDYLIFRDPYDSIRLSANAVASSADTFYNDTIYYQNLVWSEHSFNDTNNYKYKYRVCVESYLQDHGLTYKYMVINAISPSKGPQSLSLFINSSFINGVMMDSIPVNTAILAIAVANDKKSPIARIVWKQMTFSDTTVLQTNNYANQSMIADTLRYTYTTAGYYTLSAIATDSAGKSMQQSSFVKVYDSLGYQPYVDTLHQDTLRQDTLHRDTLMSDTVRY